MQNANGPLRRLGAIATSLVVVLALAQWTVGARQAAPGDWAVVGSAADKDGYLLLTRNEFVQGGAVWQREQIDLRDGFDRTFALSFGSDDLGADGVVFVLQQVGLEAVGGQGEGIGYAGITPSIGVELDTFQNGFDPPDDHVAVDENGSLAHEGAPAVALPNLEDGQEHTLRVAWNPDATELTVEVDGAQQIVYTKDLVAEIFGDDPLVYLGFTGGTGGARNPQYVRVASPLGLLSWRAPANSDLAPPTGLGGSVVAIGQTPIGGTSPGTLIGYNVYRSSAPNVVPGPATFFATVPQGQRAVRAPLGVNGSHFVVTALYTNGESVASNEIAIGEPGATLSSVKAKAAKITAKGQGFTATTAVFLDGLAFRDPAKVKKLKRVVQAGPLASGQELRDYLDSGRTITITFVNDDGSLASITQTLR